jgi:Tfp pilus assembly protein PilF
LSDINQSIRLDANDVTALHQRGNILLAMKQYADARADYEQTLKIETNDAGIWNNYGVALDGLGQTDNALQAYRRATDCQPPSPSAFLGIAFDAIRLNRPQDATTALDGFDRVNKTPSAIALALRSLLARRHGDATQADAFEKQARQLDSNATIWAFNHASADARETAPKP